MFLIIKLLILELLIIYSNRGHLATSSNLLIADDLKILGQSF